MELVGNDFAISDDFRIHQLFLKLETSLEYSRVEVAAAARRDGCSCGTSP